MPTPHLRARLARPGRTAAIVGVSVIVALAVSLTGQAVAQNHAQNHARSDAASSPSVPAPPTAPTSDDQIQNVDQVKTAIKAYYGDTVTTTMDPVNGTTALHTFAADGAYAKQLRSLSGQWTKYLDSAPHGAKPAVVIDVDDTSLNTYNYEIYSNFVYNPTSNGAFVNAGSFPAVPGMRAVAREARTLGFDVIYLTGRPGTQRDATVSNLDSAGFGSPDEAHLYLKDYANDYWLSKCAPSCTTTQYKTLTRAHILAQGYDIVGNFGDQYSDLALGRADKTFKVPNPMYFLP